MNAGATPQPIPVTIIGGFLGAGKTTLLNSILSEHHGLRAAVLVNDFGAINIDARLVVGVDGETINLANGCICCTIRDDLVGACLRLLQRPEQPEYLIVETSGISNPVPIANSFLLPELQRMLSLDSILCVVDGEQFLTLSGESAAMARVQVEAADILILNKVDLIDAAGLAEIRSAIRSIAPRSRMLEAQYGRVPLSLILGAGSAERRDDGRTMSPNRLVHDAHGAFSRWHWICDRPLSLPKLRSVFDRLPESIYRAKGVVQLEELPGYRVVLQKVGRRSKLRDAGPWGREVPQTEIVMIGTAGGIDDDAMRIAMEGCIRDDAEEMTPMLRRMREIVPAR
jgi:G3E family GTPase